MELLVLIYKKVLEAKCRLKAEKRRFTRYFALSAVIIYY